MGTHELKIDPLLKPYRHHLEKRWQEYQDLKKLIDKEEGGLVEFAKGYQRFGLIQQSDGSVAYREWAPQAVAIHLIGDFCQWDARHAVRCERDRSGVWSVTLPPGTLWHGSALKARLLAPDGSSRDIVPIWATFAAPVHPVSVAYKAVYWDPPANERYRMREPRPRAPKTLRIYEAHVGMSGEEPRVHSYREFADNVLPYIKNVGYNAVQLMALQEHAYYASAGYHVTSLFAVSSRSGTPDDVKYLVDAAHRLGLVVILDIVHSHVSSNVADSPAGIDFGAEGRLSYFHEGERGYHALWGSRCYDYAHRETLRLLLSNIQWWLTEYNIDGFRWDGVSSMVFKNHAIGRLFKGTYDDYFSDNTDLDAQLYIMLANELAATLHPDVILIAEEVSGLPTLCRPLAEGGLGFQYRLGMGFADRVVELIEYHGNERHWRMADLVHGLCFRRFTEKTIAYVEGHDQCFMGDHPVITRLLREDMYRGMMASAPLTSRVERGMSLHKMLRMLTLALGGDGYMCFMGNEFGHPEWVEFPRDENGNDYKRARRQWSLARDPAFRYRHLLAFDEALMSLDEMFDVLAANWLCVSREDESNKIIVAERGNTVFVFNFHPEKDHFDYRIGCGVPGKYRPVLDTDNAAFGGRGRVSADSEHFTESIACDSRPCSMLVYVPPHTAVAYAVPPLVAEHSVP